jgi:hypothetical protein
MKLYVNGCSYSAGDWAEFSLNWPKILMYSIVDNFKEILIQNIISYKNTNNEDNILFNSAFYGGGNDRILHTTLEEIEHLISQNQKPDLVIIEWTWPNRRRTLTETGEEYYLNNSKDYLYIKDSELNTFMYNNNKVKSEPWASEETLHYMFILQEYFIKNNIDYLFFNYIKLDKSVKKLNIFKKIDLSKFIKFSNIDDLLFTGLFEFIIKNGLSKDLYAHENDAGHKFIAKEIRNRILNEKTNKLI